MSILYFDECALTIMLIFFIAAIIRKEYKTRTNLILFIMMCGIIVSIVTDLMSGNIDNHTYVSQGTKLALYIINYIYFISHNSIMPFYILYIYSSIDIWHVFIKSKQRKIAWIGLYALSLIIIAFNGTLTNVFSVSEDCKYVRGVWMVALYVIAVMYAIWAVGTILHYRNFFNKDKLSVLLFLYIVVILGMFIQLVFPHALVEGFSIALSYLFFMVMVRREEANLDPISGAHKYNDGIERIVKNLNSNKPISVIFIKMANNSNLRMYLGQQGHNDFLKHTTLRIMDSIKKVGVNCDVYYLEKGLYACLGEETNPDVIANMAEEFKRIFSTDSNFAHFTVVTEARICVVNCPDDISDFNTLLNLGTSFERTLPDNRDVHYYKDFKDKLEFKIRNEMEDIIQRGFKENNYQMYYQPIYSVVEERFVAAEALIRLKDSKYGFISPGMFIPIAEINGDIHEIGDFVLEDVIRSVSEMDLNSLGLKYVEINLSASQCIEGNLVSKINTLLEQYNVSPEAISFELTEAATDINPEVVDANIRVLHENGSRIALDDYGTGYSNIKRVTELPIDQIKLDKSFVDLIDDPDMWIVIQEVIVMLKEMGKEVLVEGVENEEVARRFTNLRADLIQGCELIQGFYFCKPLPKDEFVDFIRSHINKVDSVE